MNGAFHLAAARGRRAMPPCVTVEGRIKYLNSTGTSVKDSTRLATSDTHHRQRQRREQILRRALQQKHRNEHDADAQGRQERRARRPRRRPLTIAVLQRLRPGADVRSMFSITTVPLSTRMPTASAKPPSVIVFSVWPPMYITSTAVTIDSGIAARMMSVSRQLPEKQKDHQRGQAGRHQAAHQHAVRAPP